MLQGHPKFVVPAKAETRAIWLRLHFLADEGLTSHLCVNDKKTENDEGAGP